MVGWSPTAGASDNAGARMGIGDQRQNSMESNCWEGPPPAVVSILIEVEEFDDSEHVNFVKTWDWLNFELNRTSRFEVIQKLNNEEKFYRRISWRRRTDSTYSSSNAKSLSRLRIN